MAALPDDERKQQESVDLKFDLQDPPTWTQKEISGLDEESQQLINHKCKYELHRYRKTKVNIIMSFFTII